MKTVFNNQECCHVWASQSQDYGRNGKSSIFFEGNTIYSYGYHYVMAVIHETEVFDRPQVVLVNEDNYSTTTVQHKSCVYNAIRHLNHFDVPRPDMPAHGDNREYLLNRAKQAADKLKRVRKVFSVACEIERVVDSLGEYSNFCLLFGLDAETITVDDLVSQDVRDRLKRQEEKTQAQEREKQERWKRLNAERIAIEKIKLDHWLAGENVSLQGYLFEECYLRVIGDRVETSYNASVPLVHALRLYQKLKVGQAKPAERIGHYTFDSFDGETVKIGCHDIKLAEAARVLDPILARQKIKAVN